MADYAVVRTDNLAGTTDGSKLVSVKYLPSGTATAIENGNFVLLGDLVSGQREVFTGATPARDSAINNVALVASVELMYDERKKNLTEFRNEAGDIVRGYLLQSGDIFSVTVDALDKAPTVGQIIELQAGTKGKVVSSLTSGSTKIGTVIAIEVSGGLTYYVIRVA